MNKQANQIKQRLSLRLPLQESLDIVAQLADALSLDKHADLEESLAIVQKHFPKVADFERDFPSICFPSPLA